MDFRLFSKKYDPFQFLLISTFILIGSIGKLTAQKSESIYFISDVFKSQSNNSTSYIEFKKIYTADTTNKTLVFLGDYSPLKNSNEVEEESFNYLNELSSLDPNAKFVFVPGFSDWGKNKSTGLAQLLNTNEIIHDILEEKDIVLAKNACPGPYEIEINDNAVLIVFNDYWLLNDNEVPLSDRGCPFEKKMDFLIELEDVLKKNQNKNIVLCAYNPMKSDGPKGGKFELIHHLFPFTINGKNTFIPLPVFGSVYIAYRKFIGNPDDLTAVKNKALSKYLIDLLGKYPRSIYLSANEKQLDYRIIPGSSENIIQQAIVGSLNSGSYTKSKKSIYASGNPGFLKLSVDTPGDVILEIIENDSVRFEKNVLASQKKDLKETVYKKFDYNNSFNTAAADPALYNQTKNSYFLMGINYRKEWAQQIDSVPVFNWGESLGSLKIVQKGGGMQTRSLRLENPEEKQYVLRSIKKYPENAVPEEIRGTVFADIVNDQISASHPYSAFAIPKMAEAAGIYHTNPQLVYLIKDQKLGSFSENFGEALYLFEERPAKNRDDVASFGKPKDIESTFDIIEKTQKSSKHRIDQQWVLKSRLFDIWIGDWDRHDDQWRWAEFQTSDDKKIYRPIPRDRDQAFFYSDGLVLKIASRKWGIPKLQGFNHKIRDINGFCFNARYFDRTFLTEPNRADWLATADSLQKKLTDSVINAGLLDLPKEIYALNGKNLESKLQQRRADLPQYANDFYEFLSKTVDVRGTNEDNRFEITRKENGNTLVEVFETKKKEETKIYEREFEHNITKEIRLYGMKGNDEFNLEGKVKKGQKIRIIGGGSKDKIFDDSKVRGIRKNTIVYDKKKSTEIESVGETANRTSNDENVNTYDRYAFEYNKLTPFIFVNYNPDDGIYMGGGPFYTTHGFRKEPFKQKHKLVGNIAPRSANYNVQYNGEFTDLFKPFDLVVDITMATPSFSTFFYGLGNNTILSDDKIKDDGQFYRVRFDMENVQIGLQHLSNNSKHKINYGFDYLRAFIRSDLNDNEENDPRFILNYAADSSQSDILDRFRFIGTHLEYEFDSRNNKLLTERGANTKIKSTYLQDIVKSEYNSLSVSASQSIYLSLSRRFKTVLALRAGGAAIFGDYPFFLAPSIGGLRTLRGHRRNRFRGDYSVYQNSELRIRLFRIRNEFLLGDFGFLLLHDIGRVWSDNPTELNSIYNQDELSRFRNDQKWHRGYGVGLWIAPFNMAVLSADYSRGTDKDQNIFLRLGFLF